MAEGTLFIENDILVMVPEVGIYFEDEESQSAEYVSTGDSPTDDLCCLPAYYYQRKITHQIQIKV